MQTTYRIKAQEISMNFLKSLKTLFAGHEVEITVKSVNPNEKELPRDKKKLFKMINENRHNAPIIATDVDIRSIIDGRNIPLNNSMDYIDTDVLIHSLVNQNQDLHLKATDLIDEIIVGNRFLISWLSIQEIGFVLAKLDQPISFISSKIDSLMSSLPVQYGLIEFNRAVELAKILGFKDFNDCLHTAIAEQYCSDLYTCNYKDFKRIQPHTPLNIHFV